MKILRAAGLEATPLGSGRGDGMRCARRDTRARARDARARGRRHFQNKNPTQRECWEQDWRPVDPRICLKILRAAGLGDTPLGSGCEMSEAAAEDVLSTRLATSRSTDLFEDSSRRAFRSHPLRERRWRWNAMRATRHARDTHATRARPKALSKQEPNTKECWEVLKKIPRKFNSQAQDQAAWKYWEKC